MSPYVAKPDTASVLSVTAVSLPAVSAILDVAAACSDAGDFADALSLLEGAGDGADAGALRGWCLENLALPGAALAAYTKALEIDSEHLEARVGLANVLATVGDRAEACEEWQRVIDAVRLRPAPDARELELAGWSFYCLGDLAGAEGAFQASLDLEPAALSAAFDLALVLLHLGEVEEAMRIYSRTAIDARVRGGTAGLVRVALDDLVAADLPRVLAAPVVELLS